MDENASQLAAERAVELLYASEWGGLVRLATMLLRDQSAAEDVVQDAFISLHRAWGRLTDPDRAVGYLRRSVVNGARSVGRHREVVRRYVARHHDLGESPGADAAVMADSRRELITQALARLPRRQREVLTLRYFLDMSEAETADALGISRGSVKSHTSRAVAAMRPLLEVRGRDVMQD